MEDALKSIVTSASRLCRENGVQADVHTLAYLACLHDASKGIEALAPGASLSAGLQPAQVLLVAEAVAKQLGEADSPILATAKMQVLMELAFKQQRELITKETDERTERVGMLGRAVTHGRMAEGIQGHERLLSRVLEYVCVAGGMEVACADDVAKEEVRVAMESVFPLSTLVRFTTLPEEDRAQQVESLARITAGICMYNKSLGKGGKALPPGTSSYVPQAQRLMRDIQRHVAALSGDVAAYTAVLRLLAESGNDQDAGQKASFERAQAEAIHTAQTLVQWENLQEDLAAGLQAVASLEQESQHWLTQVQDVVGSSSAVPKEAVLPAFERLGAIHLALTDELRMLVVRQRLADAVASMMGGYVNLLQKTAKARRPGKKTAIEQELDVMAAARQQWPAPQAPDNISEACEWIAPRSGASRVPSGQLSEPYPEDPSNPVKLVVVGVDADQSPGSGGGENLPSGLALQGFDPIVLSSQGSLARCQPQLGFITHERVTYGFSTPQTMAQFAADASASVAAVHSTIEKQPVLARLLNRSAAFPTLDLQRIVQVVSTPLKVDFGCQTPVHFVERNIDYSYEWNEWALRRRALALANLRQKKTHGTQTGLSHFKRDADSQVWQPKAAAAQTRVNKGQTMPRKLQYVAGLRGPPTTKMNVVRLELDMGQPHEY